MGLALMTSVALIYCLMVILYGSFLTPFVIMFSIPVALIGALLALAITHQTMNIFSMIGMIMLFGLVAKNGILLVDYANTLRKRGLTYSEGIVTAGGTRLRPIMMTTAAMVFGMLPLALGRPKAARSAVDGHRADRRLAQLAVPDALPRAGDVRHHEPHRRDWFDDGARAARSARRAAPATSSRSRVRRAIPRRCRGRAGLGRQS